MKYQLIHNSDPKTVFKSESTHSPSSSTSSMDLVTNGSVDFRGRVANKRKTGGWKATPFIIANEAAERLSAFTVSASLVLYLTNEMKESLPDAATHVSDWVGATYLLMLLGAFLADAYLGRYLTVILSSAVYLVTNYGDIEFGFYPSVAPKTVEHIYKLVRLGCYNTNHIFLVDKGFVAQVADVAGGRTAPMNGEQRKEAEKTIKGEFSDVKHVRGILSMGRYSDPDSAQSSFSMLLGDAPHLDHEYAIFGKVTKGDETLKKLEELPTRREGIFVMDAIQDELQKMTAAAENGGPPVNEVQCLRNALGARRGHTVGVGRQVKRPSSFGFCCTSESSSARDERDDRMDEVELTLARVVAEVDELRRQKQGGGEGEHDGEN